MSKGNYEAVAVDDTGSVEGINAFIYCTKWRSGQVSPMPYGQTLKDRASQLLIKYKSGALVMQSHPLFAIIIGIEIQRKQRGYILDHLALKDLLFFHQLCHFLVDISHLVGISYQPQILRSNLFSETTNLSSRILRRSGSRIGLRWRSCIEAACVRWARCRPGIRSSSGQVAP